MLHGWCRFHKRASWFGAFFVWALYFPGTVHAKDNADCAADHIDEWAQVAYIYDGDTIRLRDQRIIRVVAINAPELAHDGQAAQPLADAAKNAMIHLLPIGSRVGLRYDQEHFDPHRRVLAHLFDKDGRNISVALLRQGYAFAIAIPPNLWQSNCYFQQEALALAGKQGVWALPYYQPKHAQSWHNHTGGFYRVTGQVTHIGSSRRSVWLDMGRHVAARIPRRDLPYFSKWPIASLRGQVITVRGWAHFYNNKMNLTLTHPAMIESKP